MRDTDYLTPAQNAAQENNIAHLYRDKPGLATDALMTELPRVPVHLRKAVMQPHMRGLGKLLWQECCFFAHIQDDRLTEKERQVLAAIGKRLYGARSVL